MASEQPVLLPDIGGFENVDVIAVLVKPGDTVAPEDPLITLESDKATMDIPSPLGGRVKAVRVNIGDKVSEGDLICVLEADSGAALPLATASQTPSASKPEPPPSLPKVAAAPVAPHATAADPRAPANFAYTRPPPAKPMGSALVRGSASARAHASPSVRRFARELGVDLGVVQGSGPKGRIVQEDVKGHVKGVMSGTGVAPSGGFALPEIPPIDFSKFGPIETKPLTKVKRISGQALHRSWITVPHITQFDEADITDLEDFRKSKLKAAEEKGVKLTLLSFLLKAVVTALEKYPDFCASLAPDGESLIYKKYFHIGMAVNTANGLLVPVIRDVDQKGLFELAREVQTLSEKARAGKLTPAEMQGGCFTISSLGGIGGTWFTPIINVPEVAILGVSRAVMKPVFQNGGFVPRLILPFALSYDHRVIDGMAGAQFTQSLNQVLSDIRQILL